MIEVAIAVVVSGNLGVLLGWWMGYRAGHMDGKLGIRQCWPWQGTETDEE